MSRKETKKAKQARWNKRKPTPPPPPPKPVHKAITARNIWSLGLLGLMPPPQITAPVQVYDSTMQGDDKPWQKKR